jgi:hypothetical protein
MRVLLLIGTVVSAIMMLSFPADASHRHFRHYYHQHLAYHHHWSHPVQWHHRHYAKAWGSGSLSGLCRTARSLGGPCGCFASELIFGHSVRSLWQVSSWFQFPRTTPHPGAVAIFPGLHVAVVAAVDNGTVILRDSWRTHPLRSTAGIVFVNPQGGKP